MKVLVVESNPNPDSVSTAVANEFVRALQGHDVTRLDLVKNPLSYFTETDLAVITGEEPSSAEMEAFDKETKTLISQVKEHDVLVIPTPMWNFSITPQLKAYIDRIARAGYTFKYTSEGPVGTLEDKKLVVIGARGGNYSEMQEMDFQVKYLQSFFGFLGINNQESIVIEGTAAEGVDSRVEEAKQKAKEIASTL